MKTQEILTYTNTKGESITFGVGSRYHVNVSKDVTGLSDLDDTIYSTSSMGQHGDTYTGVRIEPRPIKIKGKITERDKSAQIDLRQNALKILNPELAGTLRYYYGSFARKIGAIVDGTPTFTRISLRRLRSISSASIRSGKKKPSTARTSRRGSRLGISDRDRQGRRNGHDFRQPFGQRHRRRLQRRTRLDRYEDRIPGNR